MRKSSTAIKSLILAGAVSALIGAGALVYAAPENNVSSSKHPNLAAAQKLVKQAYTKVVAAQKANEFDMDGHAQKAKELLDQASAEIKLAAEAANKNSNP